MALLVIPSFSHHDVHILELVLCVPLWICMPCSDPICVAISHLRLTCLFGISWLFDCCYVDQESFVCSSMGLAAHLANLLQCWYYTNILDFAVEGVPLAVYLLE